MQKQIKKQIKFYEKLFELIEKEAPANFKEHIKKDKFLRQIAVEIGTEKLFEELLKR